MPVAGHLSYRYLCVSGVQVGVYLLLACVGLTLSYFLFCAFDKWRKGRGKMDTVAAGMLRLAATRGDLAALELLAQAPNFSPNAAVAGFTALHAACVEGQAGEEEFRRDRLEV